VGARKTDACRYCTALTSITWTRAAVLLVCDTAQSDRLQGMVNDAALLLWPTSTLGALAQVLGPWVGGGYQPTPPTQLTSVNHADMCHSRQNLPCVQA
jgi:hypothetical protein